MNNSLTVYPIIHNCVLSMLGLTIPTRKLRRSNVVLNHCTVYVSMRFRGQDDRVTASCDVFPVMKQGYFHRCRQEANRRRYDNVYQYKTRSSPTRLVIRSPSRYCSRAWTYFRLEPNMSRTSPRLTFPFSLMRAVMRAAISS